MPEQAIEDRYWHVRTVEEVFSELASCPQGLHDQEAQRRLQAGGSNTIETKDRLPALRILAHNARSLVILILLGAAIISYVSGHAVEFFVVVGIILLTVLLGSVQEYQAGKAVAALARLVAKRVIVLRSNRQLELPASLLVPGDVVLLKRGMIVPADLRVVESRGLAVDESVLTGEPVSKGKQLQALSSQETMLSERDNMLYNGTTVTSGSGRGVVVATGPLSELGRISLTLQRIEQEPSPLQRKVDVLSMRISIAVIILCVALFFLLILKGAGLPSALLLVGAVAVSGIPESFPLSLTLALSNGVRRMARGNAIVKDLGSVETLGTTTVICTDKTGTLTENKMRAVHLVFPAGHELEVRGKSYEPTAQFFRDGHPVARSFLQHHDAFFRACVLCNEAEVHLEDGSWVLKGEPTEGALLALARSAGFDDVVLRERFARTGEIPFDPAHKYMLTTHRNLAMLKGAPEQVLARCSLERTPEGGTRALSAHARLLLLARAAHHSSLTMRVLAVASQQFPKPLGRDPAHEPRLAHGFVFEGLVVLEDPLRPEVPAAIEECRRAGVRVVMVTGDHRSTAESIGRRLGILSEAGLVLTAAEVDELTDEELDERVTQVAIFARTTPDHKLRIVESLQRRGEIVAMTGDGVNDAPALKKADIGIAMGRGGTDVAREAANMVLADDNFATIVSAVREGRAIYSNIRRFLYYLLTGNATEVALVVGAVLLDLPLPLTAIMILFINLVTSTLPSLALSVEPAHPKVMRQLPRDPKEKLFSGYILLKVSVLVPLLFLGTLSLFLWKLNLDLSKAQSIAFVTIILFELFHAFNARSLHTTIFNRNFFANRSIFLAIGVSAALTVLAVTTQAGQRILGLVALSPAEWVTAVLLASLVVVASEIIKLLIKSEFNELRSLQGEAIRLE